MVDVIFSIAECILVISYLYRDILSLRVITIIGCSGFVIGALIAGYHSPGMKALIAFNAMTIFVNLVQLYFIIIENKKKAKSSD